MKTIELKGYDGSSIRLKIKKNLEKAIKAHDPFFGFVKNFMDGFAVKTYGFGW